MARGVVGKRAQDAAQKEIKTDLPVSPDVRVVGQQTRGTWVLLFRRMEVGHAIPLDDEEVRLATGAALAFQKKNPNFEFSVGRATDETGGDLGLHLWRTK